MATQKPISTISYNTEPFLKEKLQELLDGHIIQAYQYICHKGEDGDRDHIHLRIEPNKKLDPMNLTELLAEYDPENPDKRLTVRPWRPSKEEDWFLYAVHDKEYLKNKYKGGEKGEKLPYDWQEIKVPDNYDLEVAFIRARQSLKYSTAGLAKSLQDGSNPLDLVMEGANVFTLNALQNSLRTNDYKRLQSNCIELTGQFNKLCRLLEENGYVLEWNKNKEPFLVTPDGERLVFECSDPESEVSKNE